MDIVELSKLCNSNTRLSSILHEVIRNQFKIPDTKLPLVTSVDGDVVNIYPNLQYGYPDYSRAATNMLTMRLQSGMNISVLDPTKVNRIEKTTLGRLIKKVVPNTVKDDKIRAVVEEAKVMLDPEFVAKYIRFPKSVEEYYDMFDMQNGSCLQVGSTYYGSETTKLWDNLAKKHCVHPGALLAFCPSLQGVYMVDTKGATIARAVLFMDGGTPVAIDAPKGIGTNNTVLLDIANESIIKKPGPKTKLWNDEDTFTIPGFALGDELYFPWPTLDAPINLSKRYTAYDPDTETIRVANGPEHPYLNGLPALAMGNAYAFRGFVMRSQYANAGKAAKTVRARAA